MSALGREPLAPTMPVAQAPSRRSQPWLRVAPRTLFIVCLLLNLLIAAEGLFLVRRTRAQLQSNKLAISADQARIAFLRAIGVQASRLSTDRSRLEADAQAIGAAIPDHFSSQATVTYIFSVAGAAGITPLGVSFATSGARAPGQGAMMTTTAQIQVYAPSPGALLAFMHALDWGPRLAQVRLSRLDLAPGPKTVSLSVLFFTRDR